MASLLLLLVLQQPTIESVTSLGGQVARAGCWLPVETVVRGPFNGDVVVATDMALRFSRHVELPDGAKQAYVVPVIMMLPGTPIIANLQVGDRIVASRPIEGPVTLCAPEDLIVGVVGGAASTIALEGRKAWCVPWKASDWTEAALLEGFDVLAGDPKGAELGLFKAQGGVVLRTLDEAALKNLRPAARFEVVDEMIRALQPTDPWLAGRRESVVRLLVLINLGILALLSFVLLKRPTLPWLLAAVLVMSAAMSAAALSLPSHWREVQRWTAVTPAASIQIEWVRSEGRGFLTSSLAKPLFASIDEAKRCDLALGRHQDHYFAGPLREPLCFMTVTAGSDAGIVPKRDGKAVDLRSSSAFRLYALIDNVNSGPVDVPAGSAARIEVAADQPTPDAPDFRFFARKLLRGDCVFGWEKAAERLLEGAESGYHRVTRVKPSLVVCPLR